MEADNSLKNDLFSTRINFSFLDLSALLLDQGDYPSEILRAPLLVSREPWFKYTALMLYVTLALLSLAGNSIFCMVIARQQMLHSATNIIMANLGLANIAFTLFNSPLFINKYILQSDWKLGEVVCKLSSSGVHLTATSSFYFIALVAVDRWLSVFTTSYRFTNRTVYWLIGLIWGLSVGVMMPYVWLHTVRSLYSDVNMHNASDLFMGSQRRICSIFPVTCDRQCVQRLEVGTVTIQYVLPLLIILPCYIHLAVFMWKRPMVQTVRRHCYLPWDFRRRPGTQAPPMMPGGPAGQLVGGPPQRLGSLAPGGPIGGERGAMAPLPPSIGPDGQAVSVFFPPRRPNHGVDGRPIVLRANHFQVRIPGGIIQQYEIQIAPDKCPRRVNRMPVPKNFGKLDHQTLL